VLTISNRVLKLLGCVTIFSKQKKMSKIVKLNKIINHFMAKNIVESSSPLPPFKFMDRNMSSLIG